MKKTLKWLTMLTFVLVLCVAASAVTVYVADGGTGDGTTETAPVGTFAAAVAALDGKGGTIVLVGDVTRGGVNIPEQSADLTVTAKNGAKMIITGRTTLGKNENANTFIFDMPIDIAANAACSFVGSFNSVVFTKNFKVTTSGGSNASFSYYGGIISDNDTTNSAAVTTLPYSITVNGGTFLRFEGGNLRSENATTMGCSNVLGSIAAPITVTVNGGTFGASGDYSDALAPNKNINGFSLSGMSILADGGSLTINGGTFNMPIYLLGRKGHVSSAASAVSTLTASDRKYYAADGDITLKITGGTFNGGAIVAGYTEAGYSQLIRGNYTVDVTGGTFKSGTVFDATQVKAYDGQNKIASITYPTNLGITVKRFDKVNGATKTYTDPTRIAFIGDSITEGHSSTNWLFNSYPAKYLENALASGEDVLVSNFGVSSGGMRPMAVRYYPAMVAYPICLEESGADIYIFALGINDADYTGRSNGALEEYYSRYKALIKEHGDKPDTDKVYITSISPLTSATPEKRVRAFSLVRPTQKRIADELGSKYTFIDMYALLYPKFSAAPSTYLKDGIHPNDDGYVVYADRLYNAIKNGNYGNPSIKKTDIYVSDNGTRFGAGTKDNPISYLEYALSLCADTATIHILDTITFDGNINTPLDMTKLTIVGEGTGATLQLTTTGSLLLAGSDIKLDNFNFVHKDKGESSDLTIVGNYNDVEITETFTNEGTLRFYAGKIVFGHRNSVNLAETLHFDTEATASSSNDCTVKINGGKYTLLIGGSRLFAASAPLGTYSGNMSLTVGKNVTVSNEEYSGMNGMNYFTGEITANINGWGNIPVQDNSIISYLSTNKYDPTKNTGKMTVTVANGVGNGREIIGDFNADGKLSITDIIMVIDNVLNGKTIDTSKHYYGVSNITLKNVVSLLKKIV
ncbi:MAG: SGNH/GDSL hydrolase family protein [Ruminococcaceae bacterium]|nr:SGNH/GDSL hydrolase family protein [Oscillospiraceae bacterium]